MAHCTTSKKSYLGSCTLWAVDLSFQKKKKKKRKKKKKNLTFGTNGCNGVKGRAPFGVSIIPRISCVGLNPLLPTQLAKYCNLIPAASTTWQSAVSTRRWICVSRLLHMYVLVILVFDFGTGMEHFGRKFR